MISSSRRKVKIVCTLGPASQSPERITELLREGLDVVRLNFSHGTHEFHAQLIRTVRECAHACNRNIAIMQDLQGPKLRCGNLPKEGLQLERGQKIWLYPEGESVPDGLSCPISAEIAHGIAKDVRLGSFIHFDDGKIQTSVMEVKADQTRILVEVQNGGRLTSHKGMNLPGTPLTIPCVTSKDLEDLWFGIEQGVDAVALSFVRNADDITELRNKIKAKVKTASESLPLLIPKIEREEAIDDIDRIVQVADGLLIARGDMAVEIGPENVPVVQKRLIRACNAKGIPVITATQMLESMISCPTPTRAEASDVANAVFDGTDAVMLSGETASGQYPIEAVRTMSHIILEAEKEGAVNSRHECTAPVKGYVPEALMMSAGILADHIGASAIVCHTHLGISPQLLAKHRPQQPIIAMVHDEKILRRVSFVWGVRAILIPALQRDDELFPLIEQRLIEKNWAQAEDNVVVTSALPVNRRGVVNEVRVLKISAIVRKP